MIKRGCCLSTVLVEGYSNVVVTKNIFYYQRGSHKLVQTLGAPLYDQTVDVLMGHTNTCHRQHCLSINKLLYINNQTQVYGCELSPVEHSLTRNPH